MPLANIDLSPEVNNKLSKNIFIQRNVHYYLIKFTLEADFKNNQTMNKNLLKNIIVFFYMTNRKQVNFCFYLPIGQNIIVQKRKQENDNILDEIVVCCLIV